MTSRAESGFTLIEMLVVLAILGLALALVVARGPPGSPALEIKASAAALAGGLREARARAIEANRPVRLTLDLGDDNWRIDDSPPQRLWGAPRIAILTARGEVLDRQSASIRFDADGSSTGGRIELTEGGRTLEINVDWLTGNVRVAQKQ